MVVFECGGIIEKTSIEDDDQSKDKDQSKKKSKSSQPWESKST